MYMSALQVFICNSGHQHHKYVLWLVTKTEVTISFLQYGEGWSRHWWLSPSLLWVDNINILSICVLHVVVYDAVKRIVELSSIVPLLIGEVNEHFMSEGHTTCSLVVNPWPVVFFSIIQPFMVKDSNKWKRIMLMWQNKYYYCCIANNGVTKIVLSLTIRWAYRNRTKYRRLYRI